MLLALQQMCGLIYAALEQFGYKVTDFAKNNLKIIWFGDVKLNTDLVNRQIEKFIETMFALTIIKSHYNQTKGHTFTWFD